jgi:hypothetical protein
MRLRKNINRPRKLEDEIAYGKTTKHITTPAFPDLQQSQVVPFNPQLPPAAFPSLPVSAANNGNADDEASLEQDMGLDASSDGQFNTILSW